MRYDVFISYSPYDQNIAKGMCRYLQARGLRCFLPYGGVPFRRVHASEVEKAVRDSEIMIVVFSDEYNHTKTVDCEIEIAHEANKEILLFMMSYSNFEGNKRYCLNFAKWVDAVFNPDKALVELYMAMCEIPGFQNSIERRKAIDRARDRTDDRNFMANLEFDPITGTFKEKSLGYDHRNWNDPQNMIYPKCEDFVDMGLPSGVIWATCNVGATRPEEFGEYFAWGEIKTKTSYSKDNSATYGHSVDDMRQMGYMNWYGNIVITRDVVCRRFGGSCRTPGKDEIEELIAYTFQKWKTYNGVNGYEVISRVNGKSIFFPACGRRNNFSLNYAYESGCYWSSTPSQESSLDAYCLDFFSGKFYLNQCNKHRGLCVRPIADKDSY